MKCEKCKTDLTKPFAISEQIDGSFYWPLNEKLSPDYKNIDLIRINETWLVCSNCKNDIPYVYDELAERLEEIEA